MKLCKFFLLFPLLLPSLGAAEEYPTVDRVEFVLECMHDHPGRQEYLYKCSCVIDAISKALPYEDYVDASTVARYQNLGGERGSEFRDPAVFKAMAKKYREIRSNANQQCDVKDAK